MTDDFQKATEGQEKFINRYMKFWKFFHPGRQIPDILYNTAMEYYEYLTRNRVTYELFDEVCTLLQEDFHKIGDFDGFNIVAYTLDYRRSVYANHLPDAPPEPITLPATGKPLEPSLETAKAIEILKKNGLSVWLKVMEKINQKRKTGQAQDRPPRCEACRDTGWVNVKNNAVAICTCKRGQRIRTKDGGTIKAGYGSNHQPLFVRQATANECEEVAKWK